MTPKSSASAEDLSHVARANRLGRLPRAVVRSIALTWRAAPRELLFSAGLQLAAGAGLAAQLLLARDLLAGVFAESTTSAFRDTVPRLVLLGIVTAVVSFAGMARSEQQVVLTELVARYAGSQVLDVATSVELLAYESPDFHDRLARAQLNAGTRPLQIATGVLGLLSGVFAIGGIGAALLTLQPLLFLVVVVAYLPTWIASKRGAELIYDFTNRQTEPDRRRTYLYHVLTGREEAKELRAFGLTPFLRSQYDRLYQERIDGLRALVQRRLALRLIGILTSSAVSICAVGILIWLVTSDSMAPASATAAAGAMVLLTQRFRALAGSTSSLYEGSLFLEDFSAFVEPMPIRELRHVEAPTPRPFSVLRVNDVTFRYPSRPEPSLRSISLEIHRGEVIALVGENGSGKTTLAKLLAGLYVPESGTITWDDTDTRTCVESLRESVAVIFQDFVRYYLTARENVAMGRHSRSNDVDAVIEASVAANADHFIRNLPLGYDTLLGPQFVGGSDLSVGQWQRVALARSFFRDAPFIILDEPTAALDPRAEFELFDDIRSLSKGRTVLLISHRFSTVRSADRIYVLQKGTVIEHGTHSELMNCHGIYAAMFDMQASAYVGPDT